MPTATVVRPLLVLLLVVAAIGCRSSRREVVRPDDAATWADRRERNLASFDEVWQRVRDDYYRPDRLDPSTPGGLDWDGLRAELRPRVAEAETADEARAPIRGLLARLGDSHFAILPAELFDDDGEGDDEPATGDGEVGVTLGLTADAGDVPAAIVTAVEPGSPADDAGVRPGWLLLRTGDDDVADAIREWSTATGGTRIARASLLGQLEAALSAPVGEPVRATFRDATGRRRAIRMEAGPPSGELVLFPNLPPTRLRLEARTLPGTNVGYFRLSLFFDPPRVMPAFERFVADHRDADGLILDLRGNPGGIGLMATGLAGFLVDRPGLKLGTLTMRGGPGTTRPAAVRFVINPRVSPYAGPVAVLVDERSMSASEILAGGLRDLGRARVFGTPTPGSALPSAVTRLPNGDRFQYAFADYVSEGGQRLEGRGIEPDEYAPPDRAALLAGEDPAVAAALRWIASQRRPTTTAATTQEAGR